MPVKPVIASDLMFLCGSLHGEKCPHSNRSSSPRGPSILSLLLQGLLIIFYLKNYKIKTKAIHATGFASYIFVLVVALTLRKY